MVKRLLELVETCSSDGSTCLFSIVKEKEKLAIPQTKPLEEKDIQKILESIKSGKSSLDISRELQLSHWAIVLMLSLYR
jgi:hypothetical protein